MAKKLQADTRIDPFFIAGGEPGVLLIHGFLAAPDEVRPLGEALATAGMTVCGIRLSGHGTTPGDLANVHWQEWLADAWAGYEKLCRHCTSVSVAGISLGAALSLHLASHGPVHRVVTFAAPNHAAMRGVTPQRITALASVFPFLPKIGSDMRDPQVRHTRYLYQQIPLKAMAEVAACVEAMEARLGHIRAPTLLVHARHDRVIPSRAARQIAARLGGHSQVCYIERGGHTVILDYGRQQAWKAAGDWLLETN